MADTDQRKKKKKKMENRGEEKKKDLQKKNHSDAQKSKTITRVGKGQHLATRIKGNDRKKEGEGG